MVSSSHVYRVMVVAMHKGRLSKIMSLIKEKFQNDEEEQSSSDQETRISIEFLPCIVTMSSYEGEDGQPIRYLNSFNYYNGSPMTQFFDDDEIRPTLTGLAMVGYEWELPHDKIQLENYFLANHLALSVVDCVTPNLPEFETLEQEMDHFKGLDEETKAQHIQDQTMGPGKMAKFVLDLTEQIKELKRQELQPKSLDSSLAVPSSTTEAGVGVTHDSEASNVPSITTTTTTPLQRQPPSNSHQTRFACRRCRHVLLGDTELADNHIQNLHSFRRANYDKKRPTVECQSIFCHERVLEWLSPQGQDMEGKLACPKCTTKIGHWKWSGAQCSCGTWVTPAIQIPTSKVDTLQPAQEVTLHTIGPKF